jgi:hypothetical protein
LVAVLLAEEGVGLDHMLGGFPYRFCSPIQSAPNGFDVSAGLSDGRPVPRKLFFDLVSAKH